MLIAHRYGLGIMTLEARMRVEELANALRRTSRLSVRRASRRKAIDDTATFGSAALAGQQGIPEQLRRLAFERLFQTPPARRQLMQAQRMRRLEAILTEQQEGLQVWHPHDASTARWLSR